MIFFAALCLAAALQEAERVAAAGVEVLVEGRLSASGWIADPSGRVVTAAHAVWGPRGRVEVLLPAGAKVAAEVEGVDLGHDLALLRLPARDQPYPALEISSEPPRAGAEIHLYGSPQFRHGLLLPGKVARSRPGYEYLSDLKTAVRVLHVAGPAPSGTSGGCWVDGAGRVVANQSGGVTIDGRSTGIAFAAPADAIRRLVSARTSAETADAGIVVEERTEHGAKDLGAFAKEAAGVLAVICRDDGPAHAAGLAPCFLVASVDGRQVETRDAFYAAIRARKPGESVRLEVWRPGAAAAEVLALKLSRLEKP
jgi:serine protease Do